MYFVTALLFRSFFTTWAMAQTLDSEFNIQISVQMQTVFVTKALLPALCNPALSGNTLEVLGLCQRFIAELVSNGDAARCL